ncbi:hypothetical protein [Streptosporangium sp. NPDC006007]|uniref:hypothetical protein n=1 Tax=Streptosporangium sp. NPDC006007 TaxID=3154575 RepID=UPI0033B96D1E
MRGIVRLTVLALTVVCTSSVALAAPASADPAPPLAPVATCGTTTALTVLRVADSPDCFGSDPGEW